MSEAVAYPVAEGNEAVVDRPPRWPASLSLKFEPCLKKTVIVHRKHRGPLRVQKPFYPEGDPCHLYLLHPPGGMAGQDDLQIDIEVAQEAHVLLTTPAASKVYRTQTDTTCVRQTLSIAGTLEWLPQNTICFGGSAFKQSTDIHLDSAARFMGWEVISLGRPASGDRYETGSCRQSLAVYLDNTPLFCDRQQWSAGAPVMSAPWGLGGATAIGAFLIYPGAREHCQDLVERARTLIQWQETPGLRCAVSGVDGLVVIRALGENATQLQDYFVFLWAGLRQPVLGRPPSHPRIWAT